MSRIRSILFSEKSLFILLVFSSLIPLLLTRYYPTLDGPAHLYNGRLIRELFLGQQEEFSNLFVFNHLPVPNWISHFLFATIGSVFPDYLTEKVTLMVYLILTPIYFRKITILLAPNNRLLSYLIIPFCHNHLLYLGFFNLVFAIPLMFMTIHFMLHRQFNFSTKHLAILSFLLLIVYFSHLMIFLITVMIILLLPMSMLEFSRTEKKFSIENVNRYFRTILKISVAAVPSMILAINYIAQIDSLENASRLGFAQLLDMLVNVEPLITLAYNYPWLAYTKLMFLLFAALVLGNIILTIKRTKKNRKNGLFPFSIRISWIWTGLTICFLLLYFIVPNANLLTERLIFIVYLFLILGLATLGYQKAIKYVAVIVVILVQLNFVRMHSKHMRPLSNKANQLNEISLAIEPGSLLLPFNYSNSWLDMHSSGYLGSGNPIIVLENYEAQLNWFPLKWNLNGPYELEMLNTWDANNRKLVENFYCNNKNPDVFSLQQKDGNLKKIPYIVLLGKIGNETDLNSQLIKSILAKSYQLIKQNDFCSLYKLNPISD